MSVFKINPESWQSIEKTNKFLSTTAKDLSNSQKEYLTPVVIGPKDLSQMRSVYLDTTKKVGYYYSNPIFKFSYTVPYKGMTYLIVPAYIINQTNTILVSNFNCSFPIGNLSMPDNTSKDIVEKYVKFWKSTSVSNNRKLINTKYKDNFYGFIVNDDIFNISTP